VDDARAAYFASRAAPMGAVTAEVVIATFFNFCPDLVRRAVPACWQTSSPAALIEARFAAADASLCRMLGDAITSDEMSEAAELAHTAATAPDLSASGRPLFAGHTSVAWPDDPHLVLWHAISLLREYRGDGHIAALTAEGITACEALVTHAATGDVPKEALIQTRAWPEEAWQAAVASLRSRGLVDEAGAFTDAGRTMRERIEERTDELALTPWAHLGEEGCSRLRALVRPWSKEIVSGGGLAAVSQPR